MAKKKPALPAALPPQTEPAAESMTVVAPTNAPVVPWSQRTKADRLSELADMGMEQSRRILTIDFDPNDLSPGNVRRMAIVSNHALAILATQIKVDTEKLRAAREGGGSLKEFYRNYGGADEEG